MTYNYFCSSCDIKRKCDFPLGKREKQICACGKEMINYIIPPAIHFKGGGWATSEDTLKKQLDLSSIEQ